MIIIKVMMLDRRRRKIQQRNITNAEMMITDANKIMHVPYTEGGWLVYCSFSLTAVEANNNMLPRKIMLPFDRVEKERTKHECLVR